MIEPVAKIAGHAHNPIFEPHRFRDLTDKAIRRGVFHSVNDLVTAIEDYLKVNNDHPKPFVWTATAEQILAKVARGRVALQRVENQ